jgi:hypothetical protein
MLAALCLFDAVFGRRTAHVAARTIRGATNVTAIFRSYTNEHREVLLSIASWASAVVTRLTHVLALTA